MEAAGPAKASYFVVADEAANLLENSGFKFGTAATPDRWRKDMGVNPTTTKWFIVNTESSRWYTVGVDTSVPHTGQPSYRISRTWSFAEKSKISCS